MAIKKNEKNTSEDYTTTFMNNFHLSKKSVQSNFLTEEKSKIDNMFIKNTLKSKTTEEINRYFKNYLFFFETYQHIVRENFAFCFLTNVQSEINILPENAIKAQKEKIDGDFFEKIKNGKTIDEINTLFENYKMFFSTYQQFVTEDFATKFLNRINTFNDSISQKEAKVEIDKIFIEKFEKSGSLDEINILFENYRSFFDIFKEYITD
jgi:hypothetical protein